MRKNDHSSPWRPSYYTVADLVPAWLSHFLLKQRQHGGAGNDAKRLESDRGQN